MGKAAANKLLRMYSGKFAVVQLVKNEGAVNFWKRVLTENGFEYEEKEVEQDGEMCIFQGFQML